MKKTCLLGVACTRLAQSIIIAAVCSFQAVSSTILSQGDVLTAQFTDPDLRGVFNSYYYIINTTASIGYLDIGLASEQPSTDGYHLFIELFEDSPDDVPVHSESIYSGDGTRTESTVGLWADQQGSARLTMVSGTIAINGISATYWQYRGQKYTGSVNFSVTSVPIPASVWLFGSGLLGLVGIARRKAA